MKKTIRDIDVNNKKVLLRVDFNVPLKDGVIEDDNRIVEALPTINYLLEKGAKLIIVSHLGRPDGQVKPEYSLKPTAERLSQLINKNVILSTEVIGEQTTKLANELQAGQVLMLENLRYLPDEEENTPEFCEALSKLADIYVNDAFGTAHRKHASTFGVAKLLPNAIGFLIEKELDMILGNIENPTRPFTAILGGAKVSDKIKIVDSLLNKVNNLIVGGAMAYTFLKAQGVEIGNSLVEEDMIEVAKQFLDKAKKEQVNIFLPVDHIVTDNVKNPTVVKNTKSDSIEKGLMGADIGKRTRKLFAKVIKESQTVIWNGPMGVFEEKTFEKGTRHIAKTLSKQKITSIVGGGDSASAVINFGYAKGITHISTGGGASLKLFEGKMLPGIEVIEDKQ